MKGFLGVDAGTQGLTVLFTDEKLKVVAMGEGGYEMLPGLQDGCYEQDPADWLKALTQAMQELRSRLTEPMEVQAIGISGQMHGEVCCDDAGKPVGSVRLWCDSRNGAEESELTEALGVKMPKRITASRWLWTTRNDHDKASATRHLTTPSGWIAFQLTGEWNLGIGDAAGMFPMDPQTRDYDEAAMGRFQSIAGDAYRPLSELLPKVRCAGDESGVLNQQGASILGLEPGIPVAAAEGDQPAALAGSLIGDAGMVSVSFGTSVCANSVGDHAFSGVDKAVDHFCAPDGKPINMVWLRNGTTFMNTVVEMFGDGVDPDSGAFESVIPQLLRAPADCGGLMALPFMDDEPGLGVQRGGTALICGLNDANASAGNAAKAALLATMFNLRMGCEVLDNQQFARHELVLTGGLTRTPELGQILADVFDTKVTLPASADEGTAWGATLLAAYRFGCLNGQKESWSSFLMSRRSSDELCYLPDAEQARVYTGVYRRYRNLLTVHAALDAAVHKGPDA